MRGVTAGRKPEIVDWNPASSPILYFFWYSLTHSNNLFFFLKETGFLARFRVFCEVGSSFLQKCHFFDVTETNQFFSFFPGILRKTFRNSKKNRTKLKVYEPVKNLKLNKDVYSWFFFQFLGFSFCSIPLSLQGPKHSTSN